VTGEVNQFTKRHSAKNRPIATLYTEDSFVTGTACDAIKIRRGFTDPKVLGFEKCLAYVIKGVILTGQTR